MEQQQDRMATGGGSARERREHWRGVLDAWRGSGLSKAAFCRAEGIGQWRLHYWCRRLAEAEGRRGHTYLFRLKYTTWRC